MRHYVVAQLRESQRGLNFENIYKRVSAQFSNFYTKEFLFKVIDELFQLGLVYEVAKHTYMYLDNNN